MNACTMRTWAESTIGIHFRWTKLRRKGCNRVYVHCTLLYLRYSFESDKISALVRNFRRINIKSSAAIALIPPHELIIIEVKNTKHLHFCFFLWINCTFIWKWKRHKELKAQLLCRMERMDCSKYHDECKCSHAIFLILRK